MDIQEQMEVLAKGQMSLLEMVQKQQEIINELVSKGTSTDNDKNDTPDLKDDEVSPAMKQVLADRKAAAADPKAKNPNPW